MLKFLKKSPGRRDAKSKNPAQSDKEPRKAPPPPTGTPFKDLGLIAPLCQAVDEEGYTKPTPIQLKAIPILLRGRDLLGCAQTGTGKTAAFSLPILQHLNEKHVHGQPHHIRALIVTPTRELALQIKESFEVYGRHLGLRATVVFGGVGARPQITALRRGVDILVATPGRLLDLHGQGFVKLGSLSVFVLDEADRMLDMGFSKDVKRIISLLPKERQNLLFSATMPQDIMSLAMSLLHDPAKVEVAPVSAERELISQSVYYVDLENKRYLLLHLLKQKEVKKVLVFVRTKANANRVAKFLCQSGIPADSIHGNKSQSARQKTLASFRKPTGIRVLIASDLAARGIDVEAISHVINYNLPEVAETYIHRIGRTGRALATGCAISLCEEDERAYLGDIQRLTQKKIKVVGDHPFPATFEQVAAGQRPKRGQGGKQPRSPRKPSKLKAVKKRPGPRPRR